MRYNPTKTISDIIGSEDIEPTDEQSVIIDAARAGDDLVIQAYAGGGKTATARLIAQATHATGYFVVFSRAARRDAGAKMPMGMEATTGHALAFKLIVKDSPGYLKKLETGTKQKTNQIPPALISKHLNLKNHPGLQVTSRQLAMAISSTIREFEISDSLSITSDHVLEQAIPVGLRMGSDWETKDSFSQLVSMQAECVWRDMENEQSGFPIGHDSYLKMMHLRQPYISGNMWLLDEYQDTTPVVDAIIRQQEGQKIYIGDPYQAIFAWRGAVDSLQRPLNEGVRKLHLSKSFRFNHQIAGLANILLGRLGEPTPVVGQDYNLTQLDFRKHHTVLVRNNVKMLEVIGEYRALNQSVYVAGGITKEAIIKASSAYALFKGDHQNIKVSMLRDIGSWGAFCELAGSYESGNPEYSDLVALIERYRDSVPAIIEYAQRPWNAIKHDPGRIKLMTAHKSKGAEFQFVSLRDDLALSPSVIEKLKAGTPLTLVEREQVNLLYVAITRCKKGLSLAPKIKQNFLDLSMKSGAEMEAIRGHRATHSEQEIRNRTADFIAKHRRTATEND